MHEAADVLLRLSTIGKDEGSLEKKLLAPVIDHSKNANTLKLTGNNSGHRVANINLTNATPDKPTYNPQALVELISAQKHKIFSRTATVQVSHSSRDFRINSDGFLLRRSTIDSAIRTWSHHRLDNA